MTALVRAGVALHVAHTNADVADPGVSDALADRAGADRPPAAAAAGRRPAGQAGHLRPRGRRRAGRRRAGRGRGRPARRLRAVRVHLGGHRHVHPAGRGRPRDRPGGPARAGGRDPDRDGARPAPAYGRGGGAAISPPLRGAGLRPGRAGGPGRAPRSRPGRHLGARRDPAPTSPSRSRPRCRPPRAGCGSAATRTGRSARWPCAGERATTSSTQVRAAGVDAYVTADLRHHPASEALEHGGPGLVDVSHWASEWPWLADCGAAAPRRARRAGGYGGDARLDSRDRSVDRPQRPHRARSPR